MSVVTDLVRTVHRLRRSPDIDIERLSYELSEDEWRELGREVSKFDSRIDLSFTDESTFMGMRVRKAKRSSSATGGER